MIEHSQLFQPLNKPFSSEPFLSVSVVFEGVCNLKGLPKNEIDQGMISLYIYIHIQGASHIIPVSAPVIASSSQFWLCHS